MATAHDMPNDQGQDVFAIPRARILMVDDRPANLLALEAILKPLGHELVRADSGEEALRKLLEQEFAVILLDVQMPGIDGFETAKLIKMRPKTRDVPIIFITAISREPEHIHRGYAHGAVDYLTKPIDPEILRSKVGVFVELFRKEERIKAQEALIRYHERRAMEQRSQTRYRHLTDAMPLCVLAARPDGTLYYGNRIWQEYTGIQVADDGSQDPWTAVHPDDVENVRSRWSASLEGGSGFELHFRIRRKSDGAWRWHLGKTVPERDDQGRTIGWIATAMDIDQEVCARQEAVEANRTKDEFLATVSHELRTPLNAILGWTRMVRAGLLDDEKKARAMEAIERNAQVQTELIEDILDMSRIVTGKLRLRRAPIDFGAVIDAAVDTVRPAAEAKEITLSVDCEEGSRSGSGDPDRLQQVIWNLLANAIKFTPRGGSVRAMLRRVDSQVEIEVVDSGAGISPEFLPHVFERFRQAESSTTRVHSGLGLGLAIVRHLVELHGGTIQAFSDGMDQGSRFLVRLPIQVIHTAPDEEQLLAGGPSAAAEADGNEAVADGGRSEAPLDGLRVLFVDDQEDAREMVGQLLVSNGAEIRAASSAAEALAILADWRADVLVSDIGMPREDGYSLIRRVRALPPGKGGRIPAVAVTAFARSEDARRVVAEGFHAHLSKPVEPTELVALIADLGGKAARG